MISFLASRSSSRSDEVLLLSLQHLKSLNQDVLRELQGCLLEVSRKFKGCFKEVSVKNVPRVFK